MQTTILDFSLSDQVYARAKIDNVDSVGLWLGAGVMVEYALEEAKSLLVRWYMFVVCCNHVLYDGVQAVRLKSSCYCRNNNLMDVKSS